MATWPRRLARWAGIRELLTHRHVVAIISVGTAVLVAVLATEVFPYRSLNHDEGVYLQQAAMLLDGRLVLDPPVEGPFRPWFFIAEDGIHYSKYAPVPAGIFAAGMALGDARFALAAVATITVALTYATVAESFDRRTGLLAAGLLAATPLFLIQASVFLPYVPTLALLLAFAWAYLRADRTDDRRFAALAGAAVGGAFVARPYTAVLFAAPFVVHALWRSQIDGWDVFDRYAVTAGLGLAGVAVALGYNAILTGSPLRFPYQVFGPLDGPGFGRRALLGHGVVYDLDLALASARVALRQYVLRWSVAPPLGVLLAAGGLAAVLRRGRSADPRQLVIAGLVVSVPVGQLYFWGTFNAIGDLAEPGLGLLGHLGPYYHLGLLLPTVAFGAHALVIGWKRLQPLLPARDVTAARVGVLAAVVFVAAIGTGTAVAGVADTVDQNREITAHYETAYEPIDDTAFQNALVFLPTPYGPWLNHPFQYLRNDPDFDGPVVYAQDREVFEVLDAVSNRTVYRYAYRGDWYPVTGEPVTPALRRLSVVEGRMVNLTVDAGVPAGTETVSVTLQNGTNETITRSLDPAAGRVRFRTTITGSSAQFTGPDADRQETVELAERDTLDVVVYVDTGGLDSFEYELEVPVSRADGTMRAITPRQAVCRNVDACGEGAAYIPGAHEQRVDLNLSLWSESR
jgi:hypothetical protein